MCASGVVITRIRLHVTCKRYTIIYAISVHPTLPSLETSYRNPWPSPKGAISIHRSVSIVYTVWLWGLLGWSHFGPQLSIVETRHCTLGGTNLPPIASYLLGIDNGATSAEDSHPPSESHVSPPPGASFGLAAPQHRLCMFCVVHGFPSVSSHTAHVMVCAFC